MNFLTDKERQAPFAELFADSQKVPGTDDVAMRHFVLPADTALRCLRAPLTEFVWFKAKEGVSLDAVQAAVDKYVACANEESALPIAAVSSREVDNPEKVLCLIVGWGSTEVDRRVGSRDK
jgi:hypothetical protein